LLVQNPARTLTHLLVQNPARRLTQLLVQDPTRRPAQGRRTTLAWRESYY
jgi:hypothetical protein